MLFIVDVDAICGHFYNIDYWADFVVLPDQPFHPPSLRTAAASPNEQQMSTKNKF